jgi:hypothetical protein
MMKVQFWMLGMEIWKEGGEAAMQAREKAERLFSREMFYC